MNSDNNDSAPLTERRHFLNLGLAAVGGGIIASRNRKIQAGTFTTPDDGDGSATGNQQVASKVPEIDIEKWQKLKAEPYEIGAFGEMPGVCNLPGPLAKRNWPDRDKYPQNFVIDELRCIYCGMCEEACPVDAIELTSLFDLTGRSREEMVFDKEKLLSVFDQTKDAEPMRSTRNGADDDGE